MIKILKESIQPPPLLDSWLIQQIEHGKQNLQCGDKVEKLRFYERCVYFKACKVKFNIGQQRTKGTLDYVHANL